ncbi:MAG: DUF6318 family protein [Phycicoccus sp.]
MTKSETVPTGQSAARDRWDIRSPRGVALVAFILVVAAVAVVAVLFGTGNAADEYGSLPERSTSQRSDSSAPSGSGSGSPSGTPSGSGTPLPTRTVFVPPEAEAQTKEGAIRFLEYFIEQGARASAEADSSTIRQISGPKCSGCKTFIRLADELKEKGQRVDRDDLKLRGQVTLPNSTEDRYVFNALLEALASNTIKESGEVVQKNQGGKSTLQTTITWDGAQWFVEDARLVVG